MNKEDLNKIEKYFEKYSEGEYHSSFGSNDKQNAKSYYHKWECFYLIVFDNGDVYQLNSEHEIQGVELNTFDSIKIRFKSFTGEDVENIGNTEND